eukprot:CAMPEP_0115830800 /NCGR_PEP_ID=MMETSP0287-20121206/1805_1 /TAXON_ID=412157 /ORGANISM="Chrysochromulina rotalis, Strain UIO044" /LENGTH=63 /DNA_ID=CAMNT_0003284117 /DNA_START=372 /DNA_END=566 /DNA_ORIENTATION=-
MSPSCHLSNADFEPGSTRSVAPAVTMRNVKSVSEMGLSRLIALSVPRSTAPPSLSSFDLPTSS